MSEPKKRGRKPKGKMYFTQDTQDAIILYNTSENQIERNRVFAAEIYKPFDKIAENLINKYKFPYLDSSFVDSKNEVVAHMVDKMHLFQEGKGKAFSYFTRMALNYLIIHNNKNYEKYKSTDDIIVLDTKRNVVNEITRQDIKEERSDFMDLFIEHWEKNMNTRFSKQKDIVVAYAVLDLFRDRRNIENYNKKALYILLREKTNVKTHYITKIVNILKKSYVEMYENYRKTGNLTPNAHPFY